MTKKTFTEKKLALTITLGGGTFGETVADTVTLTGLRMLADITKPGGDTLGSLQLRVYGLSQKMMNRLTVIGPFGQVRPKNTVLLAAGDVNGMSTVFSGVIWQASADYNSAPEVCLNITATVGIDIQVKPADASSYPGAADVATIMGDFAKEANLTLDNGGVSAVLSNPYFPGSTISKIKACARAANVNWHIDSDTLAIWPKGAARSLDATPVISPDSGMVGYPTFSSKGMMVRSVFNPAVRFGGKIQVQSSVDMASGQFTVFNLSHSLSSMTPDGPWFTTIECFPNVDQ